MVDIRELMEVAAKELPSGSVIYIAVENGAAYIEASNFNDEVFDIDTTDMTIEDEFIAAIEWCKTSSKNQAT